jgi:hypothetical protein
VSFAAALLLTLAIEVPLYVAALTALRLARPIRAAVLAAAVNLLTHPVLWLLLAPEPALGTLVAAEVVVWAAEAGLLWLALRPRPAVPLVAVVSAGANAASILAGLLVSAAA